MALCLKILIDARITDSHSLFEVFQSMHSKQAYTNASLNNYFIPIMLNITHCLKY